MEENKNLDKHQNDAVSDDDLDSVSGGTVINVFDGRSGRSRDDFGVSPHRRPGFGPPPGPGGRRPYRDDFGYSPRGRGGPYGGFGGRGGW